MWGRTGIASMRDAGLGEVPEELWEVAHAIRVSRICPPLSIYFPSDMHQPRGMGICKRRIKQRICGGLKFPAAQHGSKPRPVAR